MTPIRHVIHRDPLPEERAGCSFSAKDLPGTVETLKREGIEYELRRLPGGGFWQLFCRRRKATSQPDPHAPSCGDDNPSLRRCILCQL